MSTRINAVRSIAIFTFLASMALAIGLAMAGGHTYNVGDGMGWKVSPTPTSAP